MTEIKRYDVNKANMIGLVRFDERESGRWVKHEDHAAIVAALQEQVRAMADLVPDAMPAHRKGARVYATAHWCDGFNACRAAILRRIDGVKNAN